MRAFAAKLRALIEGVESDAARLDGPVDRMHFAGRAASRFRSDLRRFRSDVRDITGDLRDLASDVSAEARLVEEAQARWRRAEQDARERAREAQLEAARRRG